MPAILCFGDSNTWGYDPAGSARSHVPVRHPADVRWPGVMAKALGPDFGVFEAGQNGRTTVFEDPYYSGRNGRTALPIFLETHKPLDLVVLMLGTNDLKTIFHAPPCGIADGVAALLRMIRQSDAGPNGQPPRVLVICPPAVGPLDHLPEQAEKFADAAVKSRRLPEAYRHVAGDGGAAFLDAQPLITTSPLDGLHFDAASHRILGEAVAGVVQTAYL